MTAIFLLDNITEIFHQHRKLKTPKSSKIRLTSQCRWINGSQMGKKIFSILSDAHLSAHLVHAKHRSLAILNSHSTRRCLSLLEVFPCPPSRKWCEIRPSVPDMSVLVNIMSNVTYCHVSHDARVHMHRETFIMTNIRLQPAFKDITVGEGKYFLLSLFKNKIRF